MKSNRNCRVFYKSLFSNPSTKSFPLRGDLFTVCQEFIVGIFLIKLEHKLIYHAMRKKGACLVCVAFWVDAILFIIAC